MKTPQQQQQQTDRQAEAARKKQIIRDSAKTQRDRVLRKLPISLQPKKTPNGIEGGDTGAWTAVDNHIEALSTRTRELAEDIDLAVQIMTPEMREVFEYYRGKREMERREEKQREKERAEAEKNPQATVFKIWSQTTEEGRPKKKGRSKKVTSKDPSTEAAVSVTHPRDTAPTTPLSQQEERGPTPGPSNSASGLELSTDEDADADTTTWTDLINDPVLAPLFAPDTASVVSAPAEDLSSSSGHPHPQLGSGIPSMLSPPQGQIYPLPAALFVQLPTFDRPAQFASTTMHNYAQTSRPELEYPLGYPDAAEDLLPTTLVGNSYDTTNLYYWSTLSSSSRQTGNTQADSDESPRKRQKRKHEDGDMENHEGKYLSQYRRTFED